MGEMTPAKVSRWNFRGGPGRDGSGKWAARPVVDGGGGVEEERRWKEEMYWGGGERKIDDGSTRVICVRIQSKKKERRERVGQPKGILNGDWINKFDTMN